MNVFRSSAAPLGPADPSTFSGHARTARLASGEAGTPVHLYRVSFDDGARTNWHIHTGAQWLFVVEGHIRAKSAGAAHVDLAAGDAVVFAPGEKHWHGAVPGSRGVHLAVNVNLSTEWLEPVTDAEYNA
jgi:quercetin dioxygenase-like cupin family protein